MKVFVIGARPSPDSMESHIQDACDELSWDCVYFDNNSVIQANEKIDKLSRYAAKFILREPERINEKKLLTRIHAEEPDWILVILGSQVSPKTLVKIKNTMKIPLICWSQDALSNLGRQYVLSGCYDKVYFKDPYMVRTFNNYLAGTKYLYLPEACNPKEHYKEELVDIPDLYRADITTAATLYYFRQGILEQLNEFDVKVWGNVPDWLMQRNVGKLMRRQIRLNEKRLAFSGSKIVLNTLHYSEIESVNCRCFEVAGCGAFQLMSYSPDVVNCFEPDREIVFFSNTAELKRKIKYYLDNEDERMLIAENAMRRAHSEHTYVNRLKEIVDSL